ncbi:MAG: OadG family protein [Bacteroidales bacterium]|nr:OadG family protein [Bacteroidales bacterium]
MTTSLCNIVLTAGAERMAATDPHGWTLTIISVGVVFIALIILYALYSLSGRVFSGELKADAKKGWRAGKRLAKMATGSQDPAREEVAAAIAMALDMEQDGDTYAAIAAAVHLYLSDTVHDAEPGIVTITHRESAWNNKELTFRRLPR